MATKKISELVAINEAASNDLLVIVDVSEGTTNKITKNNLLKGTGHTIEMTLNESYQIVLKLKNAEGTELSTQTIDLPNENAITNISYNNGVLTLTKQSGATSQVDISGLINGLATETALNSLANALKETIGIDTTTYNESQTYNTGDIVVQNEKIYKANQDEITGTFDSSKWDEISLYEYQKMQDEQIEENYKVITKLQEDVEDLTERVEDAENNQLTNTPEIATSHYLQDSADSRFRKFIPICRTTQESTTGKNLFGKELFDTTKWNITGTSDEFTIQPKSSGTTEQNIPYSLNTSSFFGTIVYESMNGSIVLREGTTNRATILAVFDNSSSSVVKNENVPNVVDNLRIVVYSANTKITFKKFQLEQGSTATSYEPYTGGEPAPNPNYEMPIKNCGDNVNLLDKTQIGIGAGVTVTQIDNGVKIVGTYYAQLLQNVKKNTNYYLSYITNNIVGSTKNVRIYEGTTTSAPLLLYFNNGIGGTFNSGNNEQLLILFYAGSGTSGEVEFTNIKLEEGTVATPYSPYGCGNVNEKIVNKNIFDKNTIVTGYINNDNGNLQQAGSTEFKASDYIYVKGFENIKITSSNQNNYGAFYDKNKNYISGYSNYSTAKIVPSNAYYTRFTIMESALDDTQLEQGSTATSYVPHSEQNITFPLAQGQRLMEGDYLADDGVHHVMADYIITGNEIWELFNNKCVRIVKNDVSGVASSEVGNILCNQLKATSQANISDGMVDYGISTRTNTTKGICIRNKECTTLEDYITWFKNQYNANTPLKIQYELATEDIDPYTPEQQTAYNQIKSARTYKPVTHIFSEDETPANVEIEYVVDINTIDDRITALEAKVDLLEE